MSATSFIFFFSSRRRHTRFDCDWSSDVCSSDLAEVCPSMRAQEIFVGPIGLRSGWRLLIFLAIVIAFEAAFQEVVVLILKARGIVEPEGLYAMVFLVGDAITLIAVVIATWIMARWEHRKLSSYGLPGKNAFGRRFW